MARIYSGPLMTSLEMSGVQISLLKVADPKWLELLDAATDAVCWPKGGVPKTKPEVVLRYQYDLEIFQPFVPHRLFQFRVA